MPLGEYLVGVVFFCGTWGSAGLLALLLIRRRLPHLGGAPAVLAFGVLTTAAVVFAHILPGALGLLSRTSALVVAVALLVAVHLLVRPAPGVPAEGWGPRPDDTRLERVVLVVCGAVALAWALAAAWVDTGSASADVDTLTFHTPNVARWLQSGTLWRVDQFSPLLANGNYPQNGDVVFLSLVQPWRSDAFTRAAGLPFLALAGVAAYAIAQELQAPRALAAVFGLVFASVPTALFATYEGAKTDAVMLAVFGAGVLFLLRHFRTGRRTDLALAGVGLGLAFGTKWYGVSSVVVVVLVWALAWIAARRPVRALLVDGGVLTALVALAGGFWLLRNLVVSGNPVLPNEVGLAGITIFPAARDYIRECGGSTIASYLADPGVWGDHIRPAYESTFALPGLLLGLAVVLALALVGRAAVRGRFEGRRAGRLLAAAVLALALAAAYSLTPYSAFGARGEPLLVGANTRWLLPALLVAAAVAAGASARLGRARQVIAVLALVALADGVRRGYDFPASDAALAALVTAAGAGAALAAWRLAGRRGLALCTVGILVFGLVAAHERQKAYHEERFARGDPVITYFTREAPSGQRVGLAGVFSVDGLSPVLPAFGPRLENEVAYVGHEVQGQMREYETAAAFGRALRRGRYDLVVVGKGSYTGCRVPGEGREEARWAAAAGFRKVAESDRMTLLRRVS